MRLLLPVLLLLAACNTPHPYFRNVPMATVTVDGSVFDIRMRGDLAEAIRTNPQYAPRLGPIRDRARAAMEMVTGCAVREIRGDQAQMVGRLACSGQGPERTVPVQVPQPEFDCLTVDRYVSPATDQVVLDLDCTVI